MVLFKMNEIKKDMESGNPQSRIPDVGKRKFLKKGFLALLAGVGAAVLAKTPFAKATSYLNNFAFKSYWEEVNALGDLGGGTDDIDLTKGNIVTATVSTSAETFTFSNPPVSGVSMKFKLVLTDGGSQTVNWPASVSWMDSEAPTLVTSGVDILRFTTTDGGTTWYGWVDGSTALGGDIGLFMGGASQANRNIIDYITITSTGDATDFGDLTVVRSYMGGMASSTRAVATGGNTIDYVTIVSKGDATDFGDMRVAWGTIAACSSSTRGLSWCGYDGSNHNGIEYITIASTGNSTDFGDDTLTRRYCNACASPTRGVCWGGNEGGTTYNTISYVTIASTGNASDFGDLTTPTTCVASCSNATRGLLIAGNPSSRINVIQYVTIASTGNSTDFGDHTTVAEFPSACSNTTRAVTAGGTNPNNSDYMNVIGYVTIASTGDATNFGDLTHKRHAFGGTSNAHGGL